VETGDDVLAEFVGGLFDLPEKCPICKYDLRGGHASHRCPECGTDVPEAVREINERTWERSQRIGQVAIFRWVIYGLIPIVLWWPVAAWMYRSNDPFLMWMVFPSGLVVGIGASVFCSMRAGEEVRDDGLGALFVCCLMLCFANFAVMFYALSALA